MSSVPLAGDWRRGAPSPGSLGKFWGASFGAADLLGIRGDGRRVVGFVVEEVWGR